MKLENVTFVTERLHRGVGGQSQQKFVSYTPSGKALRINSYMSKELGIEGWGNVIIGYDSDMTTIILKKCEATELGAVVLRKSSKGNGDNCRYVNISHVLKSVKPVRKYHALTYGNLVILNPIV